MLMKMELLLDGFDEDNTERSIAMILDMPGRNNLVVR